MLEVLRFSAMEYQLDDSESIDKAFHRMGADVISRIRAGVTAADTEGIHEARKGCKWLRALLRLVRSGLDADATKTELRRIRRLARMLANVRDATIRLIAFRSLGVEGFDDLEQRLGAEAGEEHRHQLGAEGQHKAHRAIDILEQGWNELRLKNGSWRHIGRGFERSYRRARKAFRCTDKAPTNERIHEWRKRVKDLMYHVRLLGPIKPGKLGKLEKHLNDLGDWLGYDHDLIVLADFLQNDRHLSTCDRETLETQVKGHRKEHLTAARHVAEIVFEDTTKVFTQKLERWWEQWAA
jgi:CHAD domain-containing protein